MKVYKTAMRRKAHGFATQHHRTAPPYILPRSFVWTKRKVMAGMREIP